MTPNLPPSMGWVFWDKDNGSNGFSDGELAYTSFDKGLRKFKFTWNGMIQGDMKNKESRIHPTQKPVALYKWILANYAHHDMKVLDTHVGSGSSIIAFTDYGCPYIGFELDKDYFDAMEKRVKQHKSQLRIL